ncbi:hypothetical protein AB0C15_16135 [Micromonospora sp. NPDC048835]|uniref:hypothetical protein n=1 Tax=Micromonospora sp. NPDC048835 TaxID=3155147 RepID=UPI0033F4D4C9
MSTDLLGTAPVPALLDYHLVGVGAPNPTVEGILVEEFTRHHDFTTTGLDSAAWTPAVGWWSAAALSRGMRTDPEVLARVLPASRQRAEAVYRALGGGQLPGETVLRTHFRDHQPIATTAPLRLGPAHPPAGFHERRVYRVLFVKDLDAEQMTSLRTAWRTPADCPSGSAASGRRDTGTEQITWELRRVGRHLAWGLDLTALLSTDATEAVGSTLAELTTVLRGHGLIPVTTERFS